MLTIIGLGLHDEKDISVKGLETIRQSDLVYLESYTSQLAVDTKRLEQFYGKEIILADRKIVEETREILEQAKKKQVCFLVVGSPFSATTHMDLYREARKAKIDVKIIENASVFTAVGITGLFLYKFGKVTTIPFDYKNVASPWETIVANKKAGLHTLVLLDIKEKKLMTAQEGIQYLLKMGLKNTEKIIGCGSLGSEEPEIQYGAAERINIKKVPQCLIIPAALNFKEEEFLQLYAI